VIVHALRQIHRLSDLLRVAGLSRSSFYYQLRALRRPDKDKAIKEMICHIHQQHQGRYGYRRIQMALALSGHRVNHKRIQRLMQALSLKGITPRRKRYNAFRGPGHVRIPNTLQRQFTADKPLTRLVTDVSEIHSKVDDKKLYISPVMDLYNGEIISLSMGIHPTVKLVTTMFKKPVMQQLDKDCLCHSDQGLQYQNPAYQRELAQLGIDQSMSRRGNCYDNACMESFFSVLKRELPQLQALSISAMKKVITHYVDYYNNERIKLRLKMCPVQYKIRYAESIQ